jgi:hypothetical protein
MEVWLILCMPQRFGIGWYTLYRYYQHFVAVANAVAKA